MMNKEAATKLGERFAIFAMAEIAVRIVVLMHTMTHLQN